MANFNIPSSPTRYQQNINSFLGVDYSSDINTIDKRRSPEAFNIINNNGSIEKRNGYKILAYLGNNANINGIWNVDTVSGEFFIVHCGTKLYEMKKDFSSYVEILTGLANVASSGLIINSKLLILDGKRAIVYDLLKSSSRVSYLDEIGYIPITQIGRSPDGKTTQAYEDVNLVSDKRINLFTSDGISTDYYLDAQEISIISVEKLNGTTAEWDTISNYTYDATQGKIIFEEAIEEPPVDGQDNIRIMYSKPIQDNKNQINKCTIMQSYGYSSNNNRVFVTGNSDIKNIVTYSAIDDITYFEAENIIKAGLETVPITSLEKLNDGTLCIMKDISDTDNTIYYVGWNTWNETEVFPITGSAKGEGCINNKACSTLLNEPLVLSRNGIFAINTSNINDERYSYHRSYYIDKKLLNEKNLENSISVSFDGKYYLAVNDNIYVADSRIKTTNTYSKYSNYQYEWYLWTGIPVKVWFVWNNKLYFGDKSGNICTFREDDDIDRYVDNDNIVKSYWETPAFEFSGIAYNKNLKRVMIACNPTNSNIEFGYITKKGVKSVLNKIIINSEFPKIITIRKQVKKLSFIKLYAMSKDKTNMHINALSFIYTIGSMYKGD